MNRYRLTFDANPKELARRDAAGSHVVLLWSRRRHRAGVVVDDDSTGELVELDIQERDNPLDLYEHPYAHLKARGHPGKRFDQTDLKEVRPTARKAHPLHDLRRG